MSICTLWFYDCLDHLPISKFPFQLNPWILLDMPLATYQYLAKPWLLGKIVELLGTCVSDIHWCSLLKVQLGYSSDVACKVAMSTKVLGAAVEQSSCLEIHEILPVVLVVKQGGGDNSCWGGITGCLSADWPGLALWGLGLDWWGLNWMSLNHCLTQDVAVTQRCWFWLCQWCLFCRKMSFFKFLIRWNFELLVACIPELVSLWSWFISNEDHFSALRLELMSPLLQNVHPG